MALLSKVDLLKPRERPTVEVPVPEFGDGATVRLRMMTAAMRDQYEMTSYEARKAGRPIIRASLVAACLDGDAYAPFTPADVQALGEQRSDILDRLFDACLELNRMRPKDVTLEKNSSNGEASAASSFASPLPLGVPTPTNLPKE